MPFYKVRKGYTFGVRDQHKEGHLVELEPGQAAGFLGYQLEGPVEPPSPEEEALRKQALPDDFPLKDTLAEAGHTTFGALLDIDDLTEIPGIGNASRDKIKDAISKATRAAKRAALRAEDDATSTSEPASEAEQGKKAITTPAPEKALNMPIAGTVEGEVRAEGSANINGDPVAVPAADTPSGKTAKK
jgi:hypothetical protein